MSMFFRRKQKKTQDSPLIRTTLSLPDINNQCIPWPEDLVDIAAIRESPSEDGLQEVSSRGSTSTIFMPNPPSAFERRKNIIRPSGRSGQRRARIPPTFNLMVVGGKQTGKTSLLRLLLETADLSPAATADQRSAVDRFLKNSFKSTSGIQSASVEICESRFDRIMFSVIDTPGLDFQEGKELKLERQITSILKYIDTQYADTMSEESKVIRQSKGDQHVHLCIYMIDPASITTASVGRGAATKARSETTISFRNPPELIDDTSSGGISDDMEDDMALSPADIRVIRRLAERTNVLPVIAHADSLTDDMLNAVKVAVRKALSDASLGFGILDQLSYPPSPKASVQDLHTPAKESNGDVNDHGSSEASEDEERRSRPVIKLRMPRIATKSSQVRSATARDLSQVAEDPRRPISPDATDPDSVANIRFSAHVIAKEDWSSLMPFAVIAPEAAIHRPRQLNGDDGPVSGPPSALDQSEDGSGEGVPQTPLSTSTSKTVPFPQGHPDDLKGVFVRKFRWGKIDVLDPTHCDFAALRTVVLSTHMKLLKVHTKEVLYEKYRTEKLLVRRATQRISEEQTQRLFDEMGL